MISDKVTVVYATSPHRFGDNDCMVNFSIETLRSFGFGGCNIIICADGINPYSDFSKREGAKKYKTYLEKLKDKSKELTVIAGALVSKERDVPDYIQIDEKNKKAKLIRVPKFAEIPYPAIMEPSLVIEYYSR